MTGAEVLDGLRKQAGQAVVAHTINTSALDSVYTVSLRTSRALEKRKKKKKRKNCKLTEPWGAAQAAASSSHTASASGPTSSSCPDLPSRWATTASYKVSLFLLKLLRHV